MVIVPKKERSAACPQSSRDSSLSLSCRCHGVVGGCNTAGNGEAGAATGATMPNQENSNGKKKTSLLNSSSHEQENGFSPTATHTAAAFSQSCGWPKTKRDSANPFPATPSPSRPPTQNDQAEIGSS
ncbi:hypothetical protein WISP_96046 [Willisornis vidua]|uniref:Uncharacterized protein n=1 Tax=Willisornis vidua TaxID=1566151 RepID=A0ABQ9CZV1_9PASS|nr:hypothetical protein WISP_96046 [Willisornis vidua]